MMLNSRSTRLLLSALWAVIGSVPLAAQSGQVARVIQTNSAGTNAHLIDPETHEVLAVIEGLPHAHGVAEHPEGLYYHFSNEMHNTVDVGGARTLKTVEHIPLSGPPNNVSMSKELRKLYLGIRGGGPYTDVIDVDTHEVFKTIRMHRGGHKIYVTEDSRWAVASLAPGPERPEDPEWQMLAAWVRGERTGTTCPI
jgi:DNA-binding beta-propeller fold protein YncE